MSRLETVPAISYAAPVSTMSRVASAPRINNIGAVSSPVGTVLGRAPTLSHNSPVASTRAVPATAVSYGTLSQGRVAQAPSIGYSASAPAISYSASAGARSSPLVASNTPNLMSMGKVVSERPVSREELSSSGYLSENAAGRSLRPSITPSTSPVMGSRPTVVSGGTNFKPSVLSASLGVGQGVATVLGGGIGAR